MDMSNTLTEMGFELFEHFDLGMIIDLLWFVYVCVYVYIYICVCICVYDIYIYMAKELTTDIT